MKIISYDHNWTQHPDDAADASRPRRARRNPTTRTTSSYHRRPWIAGTAYHCYSGDAGAQTSLHNAFPTKDIWFTECSGWHGVERPAGTGVQRHAAAGTRATCRSGSCATGRRSVINWNLALNTQGGPVNGGCGNNPAGMCTGVVTINGTTVTRNAEYYTLGPPGAGS